MNKFALQMVQAMLTLMQLGVGTKVREYAATNCGCAFLRFAKAYYEA